MKASFSHQPLGNSGKNLIFLFNNSYFSVLPYLFSTFSGMSIPETCSILTLMNPLVSRTKLKPTLSRMTPLLKSKLQQ